MMKKILLLSYVSASCLATTAVYAGTTSLNVIDASGNLNITLITAKHPHFTASKYANAYIRNHTLYLRSTSRNATRVIVYTNTLTDLIAKGNITVNAKRMQSRGLNIIANINGKINLDGMITLKQIHASGLSKISLKWVTGKSIDLFATDRSRISLAGNVGTVRAKLSGNSFLNAKYLRAQHTWLKTRNFAQAEVISSDSLQAYPSDHSNIYYYKTPKLLNPINNQAGNTLQTGWDD